MRRRAAEVSCGVAAALAAALVAALPAPGRAAIAAHDPWRLQQVRADGSAVADAAGRCEACHTLDSSEADPGTSWLSSTARTLPSIRLYRGRAGAAGPGGLACTFCHTSTLDNVVMEDALSDFATTTVKHPVGRKIDGVTDTPNEWLSGAGGAPLPDELQCLSCHAAALLTYPNHEGRVTDPAPWTGGWDASVNPSALLGVTAAGDGDKRHCVETCHGNLGAGNSRTRPKMGHYVWGRFDGTTLFDPSGRALQAAGSTCLVCHDAHASSKTGLTQDGIRRGKPDPARTAIDERTCVAVCHAPGAFSTHGHGGKTGISATYCTPCHVASIRHRDQTDDASRRRMSYLDPLKGSLTTDLSADGLDNDMNGARDRADPGERAFAYSRAGNCRTCHIKHAGHGSADRVASCLDCHDMHGDDAAINDNAAMIRSRIQGEDTVFTAADRKGRVFFRAAAPTGVCDNDACHGGTAGDLAAAHTGGTGELARPCADCHAMSHAASPKTDDSFK